MVAHPYAPLKFVRRPTRSSLPSRLALITRTSVLAPATLLRCRLPARIELACSQLTRAPPAFADHSHRPVPRQLPSCVAVYPRFPIACVYVAFPKRSIPTRERFYVADPVSSVQLRRCKETVQSWQDVGARGT